MHKNLVLYCVLLTLIVLVGAIYHAHVARARGQSLSTAQAYCGPFPVNERGKCLSSFFEALVASTSVKEALGEAKALYKEGYLDDCHFVAHDIGRFAYEKQGDLGRALSECDNTCVSGCYHGATEAYLTERHVSETDLQGSMGTICASVVNTPEYAECMHGIGHGLIDLFASDLHKSLQYCAYIPSAPHAVNGCNDGVFMGYLHEYIVRNKGTRLQYACNDAGNEYKQDCLQDLGEGLMIVYAHDLRQSLHFCEELIGQDQYECQLGVKHEAETVTLD